MGQLGFHVQPDGIVTLVENQGQAWQAGLTQNSRLVEICKVGVFHNFIIFQTFLQVGRKF